MRLSSRLLTLFVTAFLLILCVPSKAAKKSDISIASYAKYTQIPGATPAGTETCNACHAEVAKDYRHAFHAQQGIECEQCHGAGSLHVQGAGDISKIISFRQRPARDANGVCLSCHARDANLRNWTAGRHASNKLRCTDCHQTHNYSAKADSRNDGGLDVMTPARLSNVENLVPEAKAMMQPRWQANDACLRCHQTERAQMSLPYHHPLREGKMSCVDCHDPHGGAAGNNLRTANTNQLCLSCHSQYRGPFAYQHPPVSENCMTCHTAHGSPNTNLLSVSEPALCLQCHAGHHNGAGTPLPDRCTNCHGSIHGTDTPTPSGGSRFVDKGPLESQLRALASSSRAEKAANSPHGPTAATSSSSRLLPSHSPSFAIGAAAGAMGMLSQRLAPMSSGALSGGGTDPGEVGPSTAAAYSIIPGSYRFVDQSGYGGRVGEYDTLEQSAGADVAASYVSDLNHLTVVSRGNVLSSRDYQAASQVTAGQWARASFDLLSFVQQQDHYPFYAFPVLDVPPGTNTPADTSADLIPSHTTFGVVRRLGKAQAQVKLPRLPVHLFARGNWQARSGATQLSYLDENVTPNCGELCHYTSQFQTVNYTTRNISGAADVDLGSVRLTWEHGYSSFNDRLVYPTGAFGQFTPADEPPPAPIPVPPAVAAGNYAIDIPSPSDASSDRLSLSWAASPNFTFNGNMIYTRLRDRLTGYPQNGFNSDATATWLPLNRVRIIADYHQQNLINNFTPFYSFFGNASHHDHWAGLRAEYELAKGLEVEANYKRAGITRSNASLWPQAYSFDNTDLQMVVPSSTSNTAGLALRYHDRGLWSERAGYEWTGTSHPGYLTVPRSDNRIFNNFTLAPSTWLTLANDTNIIVQNAFPAIALPNTPGDFQRRNRFYINTATGTFRVLPTWNAGLGYSYQQNNLTTYMAFQNDNGVGYVLDQPAVPYKQITQAYWGESSYTFRQRFGLNLRLTYNSARSGFRPDINPNDAALFGNAPLIAGGNCDLGAPPPCFSPSMFAAALSNVDFAATQISGVVVPQWIGQTKAYYVFPRKFEGGLLFYYGSYRDYWNPNVNGTLRTVNVYVGRSF